MYHQKLLRNPSMGLGNMAWDIKWQLLLDSIDLLCNKFAAA